jgi:hypothetical protein
MSLHPDTFEYVEPNAQQAAYMTDARMWAKKYADALDVLLPEGPDKTFILRQLRSVSMWVNIAITRNPDGSPRP